MKNPIYFLLFICILIFSCKPKSNTEINPTVEDVKEITDDKKSSPTKESSKKEDSQYKEGKRVTYESAATYAAATEYAFMDEENKQILVRYNQFPEKNEPNPIIPEYLLESGDDIEGPPGANPEMVGKEFVLVYGEHGNVIEVWNENQNEITDNITTDSKNTDIQYYEIIDTKDNPYKGIVEPLSFKNAIVSKNEINYIFWPGNVSIVVKRNPKKGEKIPHVSEDLIDGNGPNKKMIGMNCFIYKTTKGVVQKIVNTKWNNGFDAEDMED